MAEHDVLQRAASNGSSTTPERGAKLIWSPFSWIMNTAKVRVWLVLFILTIVVSIALTIVDQPLKTKLTPHGIASFEFVASKVDQVLELWSEEARQNAFLSLGLDYLYMFLYTFSLSLACHLSAEKDREFKGGGRKPGDFLCWLILFALPLDAKENYALIQVLNLREEQMWALVAKWCATLKFSIILPVLGYVLGWALFRFIAWLRRRFTSEDIS